MGTLPPLTLPTTEGDPEDREATQLGAQGFTPSRWVRLRRAEAIPLGQSIMEFGETSPAAAQRPLKDEQAQQTQHTLESLVGQQGQIVEVIQLESIPYALRLRFPSRPDEVFDVWVDCVETQPEASSPDQTVPHV